MTEKEADELLAAEEEVVPVMQGDLSALRAMRERCLADGVAAAILGFDDECGSKSCAPKLVLCIREADLDQFKNITLAQFKEMVEREGGELVQASASETEDPPCPGCGTQAPLVEGACSDCGLVLE